MALGKYPLKNVLCTVKPESGQMDVLISAWNWTTVFFRIKQLRQVAKNALNQIFCPDFRHLGIYIICSIFKTSHLFACFKHWKLLWSSVGHRQFVVTTRCFIIISDFLCFTSTFIFSKELTLNHIYIIFFLQEGVQDTGAFSWGLQTFMIIVFRGIH